MFTIVAPHGDANADANETHAHTETQTPTQARTQPETQTTHPHTPKREHKHKRKHRRKRKRNSTHTQTRTQTQTPANPPKEPRSNRENFRLGTLPRFPHTAATKVRAIWAHGGFGGLAWHQEERSDETIGWTQTPSNRQGQSLPTRTQGAGVAGASEWWRQHVRS